MAAISPPPLSLRDFIQHSFPTIVGACLFVPFYGPLNQKVSVESLIVASIILGYLISSPMTQIASFVTKRLPILGRKIHKYREEATWYSQNWDYDRLFYTLNKDDKEYLYLTGSYAEFYRLVGFYLLVYFLLNLVLLMKALLTVTTLADVKLVLVSLNTSMLGGWPANTMIVLIISFLLSVYAFRDFLIEYKALFLPNGQYITMAQNQHIEKGLIAKSIWGRVLSNGDGIAKANVKLLKEDGSIIEEAETNDSGFYQFKDRYLQCLNTTCRISTITPAWQKDRIITITDKQIPYFELQGP